MTRRMHIPADAPLVYKAVLGLEESLDGCGLDKTLLDLVRMRASQINGCAYCLDMHAKELRANGETEQRRYTLDAWQECPYYTDRERAAAAWTEAVTLVTEGTCPTRCTKPCGRTSRRRRTATRPSPSSPSTDGTG